MMWPTTVLYIIISYYIYIIYIYILGNFACHQMSPHVTKCHQTSPVKNCGIPYAGVVPSRWTRSCENSGEWHAKRVTSKLRQSQDHDEELCGLFTSKGVIPPCKMQDRLHSWMSILYEKNQLLIMAHLSKKHAFTQRHTETIYTIWSDWWLSHLSEKYEFVSWDDNIPNI